MLHDRRRSRLPVLPLLAFALFVSGCSDTTGPGTPGAGPVDRVVIDPGAVLLGGMGETMELEATAYDASGAEVQATITWQSTNPGAISVSSDGVATATTTAGSAQIIATADGVSSSPALAVVAAAAAGVVLVSDDQILSDPDPVNPAADYGTGWQYRILVTGVTVPDGTLVLGTGGRPLAGRVIGSTPSGSNTEWTVELVALSDLFADLVIDEDIPMVEVEAGGGARVAPAEPQFNFEAGATDFTIGRFKCSTSTTLPSLDLPEPTWNITPSLSLRFTYSNGLEYLGVVGDISADFSYKPKFEATFEGKVGCETVLTTVTVPLSGFLSYFAGIQVPIGIGVELDAKLEVAEIGFNVTAEASATAELGMSCPGGTGACTAVTDFDTDRDFDFEFIAPDPDTQFRAELGAHGYLTAKPSVGSAFSSATQFEFLSASAGLKQSINLATTKGQVADTAYASDFSLHGLLKVGAGKDLTNAIDKLKNWLGTDLNLNLTLVDVDTTLAESPKGTFSISPSTVQPGDGTMLGDMATFTIDLDPVTYLGLESVDKVEILWKKDDGSDFVLDPGRPSCTEIMGSPGQMQYTCQTDFLEEHSGEQTFYAVVHAKLFGFALPIPFEIGKDAKASVLVGEPALEFHFVTDLEGWTPGIASSGSLNVAEWSGSCEGPDNLDGCVHLHGLGDPELPNAWVYRTFDLGESVTTLEVWTAAHDREGATSEYRIRLVDDMGAETILRDWTQTTGAEGVYVWVQVILDISAWAGQTVTIFLEGNDDGPGEHEHRNYDDVRIY